MAVVVCFAGSWASLGWAGEVRVAVAANFSATFEQLADRFTEKTGHKVATSFGSTGALYAQIMNGAPYELFLSADAERPEKLVRQGKALAATRKRYALGRLVLWSSKPDYIYSEGGGLKKGLAGRVAIANPATAPYGLAAQQTLIQLDQWRGLQNGLIRGQNIAQTFQFAISGSVDSAFIALAQIKQTEWAGKGSYWLVPTTLHHPIEQQMVVLETGKRNPVATLLWQFISSAEGRTIISRDGYE